MDDTVESSPLKRLCTFLLGLGTFALFGLLGMLAFKATGGDRDPEYAERAAERIEIRKASDSAQAERMANAPIDIATSVGTLSSKKAAATAKPVPGTAAFDKWMEQQSAAAAPAEEAGGAPSEEAGAASSETAEPASNVVKLTLEAVPGGVMKFKQTELTVQAGSSVALNFVNPDVLLHNFLLLERGAKEKVGAAANAMMVQPNAMQNAYIPQDPEIQKLILAHSKLLGAGQSEVIEFTAPAEPGDYPYVCTFPGHWSLMFGTLKVTP